MTERKIVSEQWYKVVKYEDGEEITVPYPDHRKNPDDSPPSTFNGGLSHNEQYCDPIDMNEQYRINAGLPRIAKSIDQIDQAAEKRRSVIGRGK